MQNILGAGCMRIRTVTEHRSLHCRGYYIAVAINSMNFAQPRKQSQQVDRIELKKNGLRSDKRELAPNAAVDIDMYIHVYIRLTQRIL